MEKNYRIMFIRDNSNHPVGCLAMKIGSHSLQYQVSTLNPVDRFNRPVARQLALGRLMEKPIEIAIGETNIHDTVRLVMQHISNNNTVPNRTRKAAVVWIKSGKLASVEVG